MPIVRDRHVAAENWNPAWQCEFVCMTEVDCEVWQVVNGTDCWSGTPSSDATWCNFSDDE